MAPKKAPKKVSAKASAKKAPKKKAAPEGEPAAKKARPSEEDAEPIEEVEAAEAEAVEAEAPEAPEAEALEAEEAEEAEAEVESAPEAEAAAAAAEVDLEPEDDLALGEADYGEEAEPTPMEVEAVAAEPAEPTEPEDDAVEDSRARLSQCPQFNVEDSTLTCGIQDGVLLSALEGQSFQYLLNGARADTGIKAGRYAFEAKLDLPSDKPRDREARPHAIVGVSTLQAGRFCGKGSQTFGLDSYGDIVHDGKELQRDACKRLTTEVVAVLINLEDEGKAAQTVSFFRNGVRVCPPIAIPESMKGKPLFPLISFKNCRVVANFGPTQYEALPMKVRMFTDMAKADAESTDLTPPKGPHRAVMPIGLPDEGTYDYLDSEFYPGQPSPNFFLELSERAVATWLEESGVRPRERKPRARDAPSFSYSVGGLSLSSLTRALRVLAGERHRHVVLMGVRGNLLPEDRKTTAALLRRGAVVEPVVAIGDPTPTFTKAVQKHLRRGQAEAKRAELAKAKADRKAERAKAAKEADEEQPEEIESDDEEVREEDMPGDPAVKFFPVETPDLTTELSSSFHSYTVPEEDASVGIAKPNFVWLQQKEAEAYLRKFVVKKKQTEPVAGFEPSQTVKEQNDSWLTKKLEWRGKQKEWQRTVAAQDKKFKEKEAAAKKAAEKADAPADAAAEKAAEEDKLVDDLLAEEGKDGEEEKPENEVLLSQAQIKTEFEEIDVATVDDIENVCHGCPIYGDFDHADWTMLQIRHEIHCLLHAFMADKKDDDVEGMHKTMVAKYYQLYNKKELLAPQFAHKTVEDLLAYMKDTVTVTESGICEAVRASDVDDASFLCAVEEERRSRSRRLAAGDESAKLVFSTETARRDEPRSDRDRNSYGRDGNSGGKGNQSRDSYKGGGGGRYQGSGGGREYGARDSYGSGKGRDSYTSSRDAGKGGSRDYGGKGGRDGGYGGGKGGRPQNYGQRDGGGYGSSGRDDRGGYGAQRRDNYGSGYRSQPYGQSYNRR